MRKLTNEEFIIKSKLVHNCKYSYEKTLYINNSSKVIITCCKHGDFLQIPNSHLLGSGCPKCANEKRNNHRKKDNKSIIRDFKKVHVDRYDYSLVEYISYHEKVKIICKKHGVFTQRVSDHVKGSGCNKCKFELQSVRNSMPKEEFLSRSIKTHGSKYNYEKIEYINSYSVLTIICYIHGEFKQTAYKHISGQGCRLCGINYRNYINKLNPTGWTINNWDIAAKKSKNFDSFKVYIIRCWNDDEEFYKIGRTFTTIKKRFRAKSMMPYKFEILKEFIFDNAKDAFDKETELKRLNIDTKYVPFISFNGMYECFLKINFD